MLNIYYGTEKIDKEKFIFNNIKGKTLLLVPDQFSLQAERDAFFYLGEKSLIDLRIVDFSILGHKVVKEVGGRMPKLIDKIGSQMLLAKILNKLEPELKLYRGLAGKTAFIDRIYDIISDLKRYDISVEKLCEVIEELPSDGYLKYKLADIEIVYRAYQEAIEGKYLDAEDYILFYGEKILKSEMIGESEIWIYGFDTFTPKNFVIIERLVKAAKSVNVVLTYDDNDERYELTNVIIGKLKEIAEMLGDEALVAPIESNNKRSIWDSGRGSIINDDDSDLPLCEKVTLVAASGAYGEAERAAAQVMSYVRDYGYKYGDIVIICNDMDERGGIIRRTFRRWGIPLFMDTKRNVMHHPAVSYILALMDIVSKGYRTESIIRLVKSGFMGFSSDEIELLENYTYELKINGTAWKKLFEKTAKKYSDEDMATLNELRSVIVETVEHAKDSIGRHNTGADKAKGLYDFLESDFHMPERIEELVQKQEDEGFSEAAAETAQSWNVICGILDQIVEIIGESRLSNDDLLKMMRIGLEKISIGLVPASSDRVILGTLQRTRLSRVKVLMIVGANVGVLPMEKPSEGLISDREKSLLEGMDVELSKRDHIIRKEEAMAVSRLLELPEERLYISYSKANKEGVVQRPSDIFHEVKARVEAADLAESAETVEPAESAESGCPAAKDGAALQETTAMSDSDTVQGMKILGDIHDSESVAEKLSTGVGTLPHITEALRNYSNGEDLDDEWLPVINWYEKNMSAEFEKVKAGMLFDNNQEAMGESFARDLYVGDKENLEVSASRLEKYSSCPFAHFIMYGLRAESRELYEMGAREIGTVYHHCLMKLSESLTEGAGTLDICDRESPWMTITEEGCREEIERIVIEEMDEYMDDLMNSNRMEEYRRSRIVDICSSAAWSMVKQVRQGSVKKMYFEKAFGVDEEIPPLRINIGGAEVLVRGFIDRLDVLDGGAVRIIDYKTGGNKVNPEHIKRGYNLQLMLYLKAATVDGGGSAEDTDGRTEHVGIQPEVLDNVPGNVPGNVTDKDVFEPIGFGAGNLEPAGVFYFKIKEMMSDADNVKTNSDNLESRLDSEYRLEGIVLDDERIIKLMDKDFEKGSKVMKIKKSSSSNTQSGYVGSDGSFLLNKEEFDELMGCMDEHVKRICDEISAGELRIEPKAIKQTRGYKPVCEFCEYKSICMFDRKFDGCRYDRLP